MLFSKLFLESKKIIKFITIIFKEIILNKKNNGSKKSLFFCFLSSFFAIFSIIIINSLINGFHNEFLKSIKVFDGDFTIILKKSISENEFDKFKEDLLNSKYKKNFKETYSFGFTEIFFSKNKNLIDANFFSFSEDYLNYLIKNFSKNENKIDSKKDLVSASFDLKEKYFFKINEKNDFILSGNYSDRKKIIKCESLKLKISNFLEFNSDFLKKSFFISGKNYEKNFKKKPFNRILINTKNNFFKKENIKKEIEDILKKNKIFGNIYSIEENYYEMIKMIEIQNFSGNLISAVLFLFLAIVNISNLLIFLEEKRNGFLSLYLSGYSFFYLDFLRYFFIFFSTVFGIFLGSIFSIFLIKIIDFFELIKIDYFGEAIKIPFLISNKIIICGFLFNFLISIIIFFKEKSNFKKSFENNF